MKKNKIIILILCLSLLCGCSFLTIDDYYEYTNNDIIANIQNGYSYILQVQGEIDNKTDNIINEIIENPENDSEEDIKVLYNLYLDTDKRNSNDLDIIQKYINLINSSQNISEFINNAQVIENELSIDIFTSMSISKDYYSDKNMIYFTTVPFDYNLDAIYIKDDNFKTYKSYVSKYNIELLKEYGYSEGTSKDIVKNVTSLNDKLAENSKSIYYEGVEDSNNYITKDELQKIYTKLDIDTYLKNKGINETKFGLIDKDNYVAINESLTNDNLDAWKNKVMLRILQEYGLYLNEDYANIINEYNKKTNNDSDYDVNKLAIKMIKKYYTNTISTLYIKKYFTDDYYTYLTDMTNDIINEYTEMLDNNTFLSKNNIEYAKEKLNNITINIGKKEEEYDNYNVDVNKSLVFNIINIKKMMNNNSLSVVGTNNKIKYMDQTEFNAYYEPMNNSINIMASAAEFTNLNDSYYVNLGKIGTIIGHEITHAFDSNGSKFDKDGRYNIWWDEETTNNFENIKEKIINYYNNYDISISMKENGTQTIDENIADLGSVHVTSNILQKKGASNSEAKDFFENYALLWANNSGNASVMMQAYIDVHSPNKIRVNAVLSSTDYFYKVYNIKSYDKMYYPKEDRILVY